MEEQKEFEKLILPLLKGEKSLSDTLKSLDFTTEHDRERADLFSKVCLFQLSLDRDKFEELHKSSEVLTAVFSIRENLK